MNKYRDNASMLRRLGLAVIAGTLALGVSGVASAHGPGGYGKHARKVVHHQYHQDRRGHRGHVGHRRHRGHGYGQRRGHGGHHGHRAKKVVRIHHYDRYPVYEQPVVVERDPYPPSNYGHQASGYGDGRVTPTFNAGSLMGAAIGGLIGSQIGGGTGKLAATAAGTVGGFVLGDHATRGYR